MLRREPVELRHLRLARLEPLPVDEAGDALRAHDGAVRRDAAPDQVLDERAHVLAFVDVVLSGVRVAESDDGLAELRGDLEVAHAVDDDAGLPLVGGEAVALHHEDSLDPPAVGKFPVRERAIPRIRDQPQFGNRAKRGEIPRNDDSIDPLIPEVPERILDNPRHTIRRHPILQR